MEWFINFDRELFLILNGLHSVFCDPVMIFLSKIWVWAPLYIAIFVWIFIKKKWKVGLIMLITVIIAFALSDQISVLIKNSIGRLRPCEDPVIGTLAHVIEKRGSLYGFVSGHAANTFCFALLTSIFVGKPAFSYSIFAWATLVSYSRIYVGKHFPADIIGGILLGLLIGLVMSLLFRYFVKLLQKKYALHHR
ncbi:MAG: phosphatase PAP2 family protein [Bacteroidales bacterium]|nr:phosphatase PAP2 family protein [Bacteroidales bacterium]